MKPSPLISVIVPVFNAEKYLERCLNSILNQSLRNIELICVDDGSKDASSSILHAYSKNDKRLKLITEKNQGPGIARNNGFATAKGIYVSFFDADDFMCRTFLEQACVILDKDKSNLLIARSWEYDETSQKADSADWTIAKGMLPKRSPFSAEEIANYIFNICPGWAWDKVFRSDFIRKHNLNFAPLRNSEDLVFVYAALALAEKISVTNEMLLYHSINIPQSVSSSRAQDVGALYEALLLLEKTLKGHSLVNLQRSFINRALDLFIWHIDSLDSNSGQIAYTKFKEEWSDHFDFKKFPFKFYYDKSNYIKLSKIKNSDYKNYITRSKTISELLFQLINYVQKNGVVATTRRIRQKLKNSL